MRVVLLFAVAVVLGLAGCSGSKLAKGKKKDSRYLPKEFSNIQFDASMVDILAIRNLNANDLEDGSFRFSLVENIQRDNIEKVVYYFGKDEHKPLYELIIVYETEASRDAVAQKLFGEPNHKGKEWMVDSGNGYRINAWKHETKLVVAAKIAGTEWEEEE